MQVLRIRSLGPDVRRVQQTLNGCMLPPINRFTSPAMPRLVEDGVFGPKTRAMVCEFQRLNGVRVDGIVGPVTSYLLFPYISFTAKLAGQGRIQGISQQTNPPLSRSPLGSPTRSGRVQPAAGGDKGDDNEEEGFTFEGSIAPGFKREFKPWFVLKPDNPPEGAKSLATLTVEATVLRLKGFEFGGELEFSRPVGAQGGSSWEWEGTIAGQYTHLKAENRRFAIVASPVAELKVKQGLIFGAAAGVSGEAALKFGRQDRLELVVGGKVAGEWNSHDGNVKVGEEVTVGLKFKWDVTRSSKKQ